MNSTTCRRCGTPVPEWDRLTADDKLQLAFELGIRPECPECIRQRKGIDPRALRRVRRD